MHYLLGLAALVIGALIATRRTRPTWFVVLTCVLVGVGGLLAILSYTRVTDSMGLLANSILGWVFVGISVITMLSSIFVLERRGEHGEELPPLIGDNPFDGDADDSDDPTPRDNAAAAAAAATITGAAASAGAAGAAAAGSTGYAGVGVSGTEAFAEEAAAEPAVLGADPDLATPPATTDVDAAPEGGAATDGDPTTDRWPGAERP